MNITSFYLARSRLALDKSRPFISITLSPTSNIPSRFALLSGNKSAIRIFPKAVLARLGLQGSLFSRTTPKSPEHSSNSNVLMSPAPSMSPFWSVSSAAEAFFDRGEKASEEETLPSLMVFTVKTLVKLSFLFSCGEHSSHFSRLRNRITVAKFELVCHKSRSHQTFHLLNSHHKFPDEKHTLRWNFFSIAVRIQRFYGLPSFLFVPSFISSTFESHRHDVMHIKHSSPVNRYFCFVWHVSVFCLKDTTL